MTLCIYHGNCADGFGAAWVVRKALGNAVEFHPGVYQDAPPEVNGRPVDSQEIIDWLNIMALAHPEFEMGLDNTARIIEYLTQDRPPPAKSVPMLRLVA